MFVPSIKCVQFGCYEIDTHYYSPYPPQLLKAEKDQVIETLYVCHRCFKYTVDVEMYRKHKRLCNFHVRLPGSRVYSHDKYRVQVVDGNCDKLFCQSLALFAKLFLQEKTVCYEEIERFLFYILYAHDEAVGFYSNEKLSWDNYTLACILVFPPFQRRGYGKFLMSLSYELARKDGKLGSPEKPLSDLGYSGFKAFWMEELLRILASKPPSYVWTVEELSKLANFTCDDILTALIHLNIVQAKKQSLGTLVCSYDAIKNHPKFKNPSPRVDPKYLI